MSCSASLSMYCSAIQQNEAKNINFVIPNLEYCIFNIIFEYINRTLKSLDSKFRQFDSERGGSFNAHVDILCTFDTRYSAWATIVNPFLKGVGTLLCG